jgi:hypothetical protein
VVRQAYCIVVTRGIDDVVHAFKVAVDTTKPLFQTIKEDPKSRVTDLPLTPDAILPGSTSGFDLWREDEDRRRVKTISSARSRNAQSCPRCCAARICSIQFQWLHPGALRAFAV